MLKAWNVAKTVWVWIRPLILFSILFYTAYIWLVVLHAPHTVMLAGVMTALYLLLVAFHELGHVLAGLVLGYKFERASVRALTVAVFLGGKTRTNFDQIFISFAGPALQACMGLLVVAVSAYWAQADLAIYFYYLGWAAVLEAAVNLALPIPRMDGGRLMRALYHCARGRSSHAFLG